MRTRCMTSGASSRTTCGCTRSLAQVLPFSDVGLEKLYAFARHLRRLLPHTGEELPREIQQNIDMESYRIQETGSGKVALDRKGKGGRARPRGDKGNARKARQRSWKPFRGSSPS